MKKHLMIIYLLIGIIFSIPCFVYANTNDNIDKYQIEYNNIQYIKTSYSDIVIPFSNYENITKITMGEKELDTNNYSISNDSVIINGEWLENNVDVGIYEVDIYTSDGKDNYSIGYINLEILEEFNSNIEDNSSVIEKYMTEKEIKNSIEITNRDVYVLNYGIDLVIEMNDNLDVLSVLIDDKNVDYTILDNNIIILSDVLNTYNCGNYEIKVDTVSGTIKSFIRVITIDEFKSELPHSYTVDYDEKDVLETDEMGNLKITNTKVSNEVVEQITKLFESYGIDNKYYSTITVEHTVNNVVTTYDVVPEEILSGEYPINYEDKNDERLDVILVSVSSIDYFEYITIIFNNTSNYIESNKDYVDNFVNNNDLNYYYDCSLNNYLSTSFSVEEMKSLYPVIIDNLNSILEGTGIEVYSNNNLYYTSEFSQYLLNNYFYYRVHLFKDGKYYKTIPVYYIYRPIINIPWYIEDDEEYILKTTLEYLVNNGYPNEKLNNLTLQNNFIVNKNNNKNYGSIIVNKNEKVVYNIVDNYFEYEKESNKDIYISFDGVMDNVKRVLIDRDTVDNNNYYISNNQLVINSKFLDTLSSGTYKVIIETELGSGEVDLIIVNKQYHYIIGNSCQINYKNVSSIIFKIDADLEKFVSVYINDWKVPRKYYTLRKGSTIIDFSDEFLKSLKKGYYVIKSVFTDGEAITYFTISDDEVIDNTEVDTNINTNTNHNTDINTNVDNTNKTKKSGVYKLSNSSDKKSSDSNIVFNNPNTNTIINAIRKNKTPKVNDIIIDKDNDLGNNFNNKIFIIISFLLIISFELLYIEKKISSK